MALPPTRHRFALNHGQRGVAVYRSAGLWQVHGMRLADDDKGMKRFTPVLRRLKRELRKMKDAHATRKMKEGWDESDEESGDSDESMTFPGRSMDMEDEAGDAKRRARAQRFQRTDVFG